MEAISGPFIVACALLMVAGAAKFLRPDATAAALQVVGLPGTRRVARALGLAEVAIGAGGLAVGNALAAAAVAAAYVGFAGFVAAMLRRRDRPASCGCFGRDDTPASAIHLLVNLAAVAVAVAAAIEPVGSLRSHLAGQPLAGVTYLTYVALGTYLAYMALTALPRARAPLGSRA